MPVDAYMYFKGSNTDSVVVEGASAGNIFDVLDTSAVSGTIIDTGNGQNTVSVEKTTGDLEVDFGFGCTQLESLLQLVLSPLGIIQVSEDDSEIEMRAMVLWLGGNDLLEQLLCSPDIPIL